MRLTESRMRDYAKSFLMKNYGLSLDVPLELNGRLRTTFGRFVYTKFKNSKSIPKTIQLNKYFFENNSQDVILDVLKHELIHYALFMKNKPHNDGDAYFENELKRLGVVSQRTINKYEINKKPSKYYHYCCTDCKQEYSTRKSLSKNNRMMFKCRCDGKLLFLGRKEVKK